MTVRTVIFPKRLELTSDAIETYFEDSGMDVSARIDEDFIGGFLKIKIRPNIYVQAQFSHEMLESKDNYTFTKGILDQSLNALKEYYYKVFQLGKQRVIPSRQIDKYCILFNPDEVDYDTINKIIVALEL